MNMATRLIEESDGAESVAANISIPVVVDDRLELEPDDLELAMVVGRHVIASHPDLALAIAATDPKE
jgi:hypothetical protein